ncbi:MAG: hypothetical protein COA94_03005 [Rickettsiales bacterium]|nr:MAG: hypothetical protein COA94_03005 [Rickettsiales bacterium]
MVTLLASIAGFLTSIIPEIIKYFKDMNDKEHELSILEIQMQYNRDNDARSLEEIYVARDILEQASLYATFESKIWWVDMLNGSVRPVLAYSFFIMYVAVKYLQYNAISASAHIVEHIEIIWNIDDQAIFASVVSFYYGQRTFRRSYRT